MVERISSLQDMKFYEACREKNTPVVVLVCVLNVYFFLEKEEKLYRKASLYFFCVAKRRPLYQRREGPKRRAKLQDAKTSFDTRHLNPPLPPYNFAYRGETQSSHKTQLLRGIGPIFHRATAGNRTFLLALYSLR